MGRDFFWIINLQTGKKDAPIKLPNVTFIIVNKNKIQVKIIETLVNNNSIIVHKFDELASGLRAVKNIFAHWIFVFINNTVAISEYVSFLEKLRLLDQILPIIIVSVEKIPSFFLVASPVLYDGHIYDGLCEDEAISILQFAVIRRQVAFRFFDSE